MDLPGIRLVEDFIVRLLRSPGCTLATYADQKTSLRFLSESPSRIEDDISTTLVVSRTPAAQNIKITKLSPAGLLSRYDHLTTPDGGQALVAPISYHEPPRICVCLLFLSFLSIQAVVSRQTTVLPFVPRVFSTLSLLVFTCTNIFFPTSFANNLSLSLKNTRNSIRHFYIPAYFRRAHHDKHHHLKNAFLQDYFRGRGGTPCLRCASGLRY